MKHLPWSVKWSWAISRKWAEGEVGRPMRVKTADCSSFTCMWWETWCCNAGRMRISHRFLYFDQCLPFLTRSIFSFLLCPTRPVASLRFCKNTAGSVSSFCLLFPSCHASCLMASLCLRKDAFFFLLFFFLKAGCIRFVVAGCFTSDLAVEQPKFSPACNRAVTVPSIITLSRLCPVSEDVSAPQSTLV